MTKTKVIRWAKATCPVCGEQYDYIEGGHKPPTCNKFDCLYRWCHSPQFKDKGGDVEAKRKE